MTEILGREEIIKLARQLATPVDFKQLEKEGIIEKDGAWYKIKDFNSLPEYAYRQINEFRTDSKGNILVKFPKSWKKAQKLYQKMAGKEYNE